MRVSPLDHETVTLIVLLGYQVRWWLTLAQRLRAAGPSPGPGSGTTGSVPTVAAEDATRLGTRQKQVLALTQLAPPPGVTAEQVADAVDMKVTNAHRMLGSLEGRGLIWRVAGSKPTRWTQTRPET